jgi:HEAT repeat protein
MKHDPCRLPRSSVRLTLLVALVAALPALAGCPKSDDPKYYISKLQSSDAEVQRRAVEELVRMQKETMPFVPDAVKSDNPNVRKGIADFLSKVRRMESLTALEGLMGDRDKDVRLKAIEAAAGLSQVWKKKAVELLTQAFNGTDPDCIKKAGEGLRDMKYDEATDALRKEFEAGKPVQAVYAAKLLYETEPSPKLARVILTGLLSDEAAVRDAAKANVKELMDKIVPELVKFVDTEPGTGRALRVLEELRDKLVSELDVILDSARAAEILAALGTIADDPSIKKLEADLGDTKLESAWRVAAARSLAIAAASPRCSATDKASVRQYLFGVLDDEDQDNRIRIGAAIALSELKEDRAVTFLLDQLNRFAEDIKQTNISEARRDDLTALRIGAQEALTTAGDFVVPFLMERLRGTGKDSPGPIIIWAAAKTFGELKVREAVPFLGKYLSARKDPLISLGPDGTITAINLGRPLTDEAFAQLGFLFPDAKAGALVKPAEMKDWQKLTEEEAAKVRTMLDVFSYPDYVRWTSAIALGRIGGTDAQGLLRQGEKDEDEFLAVLAKAKTQKDYAARANVMDGLVGQHEDVLFYIHEALGGAGQQPAPPPEKP